MFTEDRMDIMYSCRSFLSIWGINRRRLPVYVDLYVTIYILCYFYGKPRVTWVPIKNIRVYQTFKCFKINYSLIFYVVMLFKFVVFTFVIK